MAKIPIHIDSKKVNNNSLAWILLISLSLIWGSSFILIKKSLIAFTPLQVGTGRVAIAFIAFLPLFIYHFKSINWSKFWPLLVVGLLGSGLPAILFALGQKEIPSGIAGVLNSLTPIFTLIIAILVFKRPFIKNQLWGILIGLIGVSLIFFIKEGEHLVFQYYYAFFIILATIFYAISGNTVSHYLRDVKPLLISTISFVLIGPFLLGYLLTTDFIDVLQTHPHGLKSLLSLMTLSLICTFLANVLYFKLIQITEAIFSSTVSYLIPFIALMWAFWDGEYMSLFHFLSLVLILTGISIVKKASKA